MAPLFYFQPVVIRVISIHLTVHRNPELIVLPHEPNIWVLVKMRLEGRGPVKFAQARTHIMLPEKNTCAFGSRNEAQLGFAIV